ncbi:MAG: DsbA family protein [Proteobacteria bacterium]|nr:DsbA family protein [Pseudomonadota bacterium]
MSAREVDRRMLVLGASVLALAISLPEARAQTSRTADDMVLGSPQAPVTLIEYASAACPHCAHFHEDVFPQLKANYIDTGKVFFIFRETLTSPAAVALAGFQVARCNGATADQYFSRVGEIFASQRQMFATGTMQGVVDTLNEVGTRNGLSADQVMQCIQDPAGEQRIRRFDQGSIQFNVTGTPTFILNGQKVDDPAVTTYDGLSRILDQALATDH